jgi:hypothetical protein
MLHNRLYYNLSTVPSRGSCIVTLKNLNIIKNTQVVWVANINEIILKLEN